MTITRSGYFSLDTEGHAIIYDPKTRAWSHEDAAQDALHAGVVDIVPELRYAIDATCPGCKYPEIGYAPEREVFICSNCKHEQTDRPST